MKKIKKYSAIIVAFLMLLTAAFPVYADENESIVTEVTTVSEPIAETTYAPAAVSEPLPETTILPENEPDGTTISSEITEDETYETEEILIEEDAEGLEEDEILDLSASNNSGDYVGINTDGTLITGQISHIRKSIMTGICRIIIIPEHCFVTRNMFTCI